MYIGKHNDIFKKRIQEAMKAKHLRNADIIEASKIRGQELSSSAVAQYKSGKYIPKKEKLSLLASILDVSEEWLLGIDTDKKKTAIVPTADEISILYEYRKLNADGKIMFRSLLEMITNNKKYSN